MENYFIIHCNADGEITAEQISHKELIDRLNDRDYYGEDVKFITELTETDPQYWDGNVLIIKGKITEPTFKSISFE